MNLGTNHTSSAKRRLFPLSRTPPSALSIFKTSDSQYGQLPRSDQLHISSADDDQDYLSDGGSSSSSGTTKITGLSNIELPDANGSWISPESDGIEVAGMTDSSHPRDEEHGDNACEEGPSTPCPVREVVQNGKHAAFSTTPTRNRDKAAWRSVRWNSRTDVYDSEPSASFEPRRSLPDLRVTAYEIDQGTGDAPSSPLRATNQIPLNDTIHRIDTWNTSVKLCTVIKRSQKGVIEVHHHVQLSVVIPKQDVSTTRISIRLEVANGVQRDRTYNLDHGQSSLFFGDDVSLFSPNYCMAEINIIRDRHDAEEPLNIYIYSTFPEAYLCSTALLPTFRPSSGKVLSESVFVAEPVPPLIIRATMRDHYSTWKSIRNSSNEALHFERLEVPPLYPEGFKDDLRITIIEPDPVRFLSIGGQGTTGVVRDLAIKVQKVLGLQLECRMSLWLEVGTANILLSMDPHGWIPKFFLLDNRLATEVGGEWRQNEGSLTLFKQPQMVLGPLKIEMCWQEPSDKIWLDETSDCELLLPRVLDYEVLGGSFSCGTTSSASFGNPGVKDHLFLCDAGAEIRLPCMHKGYSLRMTRMPNRSHQSFSWVTDNVPTLEDLNLDANAVRQPNLIEAKAGVELYDWKAATTSHPSTRALILQATFAWIVISCLYFGAELTRQRSDYRKDLIAGTSNLSTSDDVNIAHHNEAGSVLSGSIKAGIAGAGAIYDNNDEEDSAGWRDWMDTSLGWKGYTP